VNTVNLPRDPKVAGKIVDAQALHEAQRIEIGLLGRLFGGKTGAPANTASLLVFIAFLVLVFLLIWGEDTPTFSRKDAVSLLSSFITLALGYLFGKGTQP
jgi:uncharacterized membrane protein YtjA (UPF0391 family)